MRGFQNTILVLVVLVLGAQLTHFTYMKFLLPRHSVLDAEVDQSIKSAKSLKHLLEQLEQSEKKVKEYENKLSQEDLHKTHRQDIAPYLSNRKLKSAIRDWERKQGQLNRLIFQWTIGLLFSLAGAGLYFKRISWIGSAFIVAGLAEMIWWCSPSIALGGAINEFERILNVKLILSLITMAAFAGIWPLWQNASLANPHWSEME